MRSLGWEPRNVRQKRGEIEIKRINKGKKNKSDRDFTDFQRADAPGELLAYLCLNRLLNGLVLFS